MKGSRRAFTVVSAGLRQTLGRIEHVSGAASGGQHLSTIVSAVPNSGGEVQFPPRVKVSICGSHFSLMFVP